MYRCILVCISYLVAQKKQQSLLMNRDKRVDVHTQVWAGVFVN